MTSSPAKATVYIFLEGQGYVPAGIVQDHGSYCTFRYGRRYRARPDALPIDPVSLPLEHDREVRTAKGRRMFNALRDAAPDKWGRKVLAAYAGSDFGQFSELELLTAFHSPLRIGGLAFGPDPASGPQSRAPWAPKRDPFVRTREDLERVLEVVRIIERLGEDEGALDEFRARQADPFFQACTSIFSVGGARPKCLVEIDGEHWIAKFRKADDSWNEPRIEHATMQIARECGVDAAETRLLEGIGGHDVLLVKRFDRYAAGNAQHVISGLTLGDRTEDGDWGSYQDLAEQSRRFGDADAGEQLFRRMVVNMFFGNTDDHLRNHAWFVTASGVRLTPAFDVLPQWMPNKGHQALRCGAQGHVPSLSNALSDVYPFGLLKQEAHDIIVEIHDSLMRWEDVFRKIDVSGRNIEAVARRIQPLLN